MDLRETNPGNKNRHPWELARAAALDAFAAGLPRSAQFADIGAGDLFFARKLAARSDKPVLAVDTAYPAPSSRDGCLLVRDVASLPAGGVDCMFVMDLLEHIEDDEAFARMLAQAVSPGGRALFTVPAHPCLFSAHDEFMGHRRRYTPARLRAVLAGAGFDIREVFGFFVVPLVVRCAEVAWNRVGLPARAVLGIGNWRLGAVHVATRTLTASLRLDFRMNRAIARLTGLSTGLSLCAVCRIPPVQDRSEKGGSLPRSIEDTKKSAATDPSSSRLNHTP